MPFDNAIRSMLREEIRTAVREELRALLPKVPASPAQSDDFLSVQDAAKVARVCAATVRSWLRHGQLKRYGTARLPRIRRSELVRFMATQPSSESEPPRPIDEQVASILSRPERTRLPRASAAAHGERRPAPETEQAP